jgi:hypothetical protein
VYHSGEIRIHFTVLRHSFFNINLDAGTNSHRCWWSSTLTNKQMNSISVQSLLWTLVHRLDFAWLLKVNFHYMSFWSYYKFSYFNLRSELYLIVLVWIEGLSARCVDIRMSSDAVVQWCATGVPWHISVPPRPSRCATKFTPHYNYNHNELNNCLSCFLLCLSFHFLYYSRADRGQTRSTEWNWKVTHPSLPPPPPTPEQYAKCGWCAAMTLWQYLVCRKCRKVAQYCCSEYTCIKHVFLLFAKQFEWCNRFSHWEAWMGIICLEMIRNDKITKEESAWMPTLKQIGREPEHHWKLYRHQTEVC